MSNSKPPPRSKPQSPQGISVSAQDLATRVANIEQFLKDQFDERNQWNATLRTWVGRTIKIRLVDGHILEGLLNWVDRYTLCVGQEPDVEIVHKGAVATIKKA